MVTERGKYLGVLVMFIFSMPKIRNGPSDDRGAGNYRKWFHFDSRLQKLEIEIIGVCNPIFSSLAI